MPLIGYSKLTEEEYSQYLIVADDIIGIQQILDRIKRPHATNKIRLQNALEARKNLDRLIFYLGGEEDNGRKSE